VELHAGAGGDVPVTLARVGQDEDAVRDGDDGAGDVDEAAAVVEAEDAVAGGEVGDGGEHRMSFLSAVVLSAVVADTPYCTSKTFTCQL
jgi:hypothetical protein